VVYDDVEEVHFLVKISEQKEMNSFGNSMQVF